MGGAGLAQICLSILKMLQALPLLIWVAVTLVIGAVAAQLAQRNLDLRNIADSLVGELLLSIYMIGIPFVALILGVVGQDLIGLGRSRPDSALGFTDIEWVAGLARVALAGSAVCAVLWLMGREQRKGTNPPALLLNLRNTLYDEVHWVFCFSVGALAFNNTYWGVLLGIGLIVLIWISHPRFANRLGTQHGRQRLLVRSMCLLTSGLIYAGPQNLWLMLLADALIRALGPLLLQPSPPLTLDPANPKV